MEICGATFRRGDMVRRVADGREGMVFGFDGADATVAWLDGGDYGGDAYLTLTYYALYAYFDMVARGANA